MRHEAVLLTVGLMIALVPSSAIPVRASPVEIENRILRAITFVKSHFYSAGKFSGFIWPTDGVQSNRTYGDQNALIALALSAYQETHFTAAFYGDLKDAVQSVVQLQTPRGDFCQYYDFQNKTPGRSGKLYYWNAYVIMGISYAAYAITNQVGPEQAYWLPVINRLRMFIDNWIPRYQTPSGAVTFSFLGKPDATDVALNGALLMGLVNVAAFESLWGDRSVAVTFGRYSQRIANWLYGLQETSETSWGFGGFYSNSSKKLQSTLENGFAMFGLNSFYKAASLLLPKVYPTLEPMREVMVAWARGYEAKVADIMGGPANGRGAAGLILYPETTQAVSATLVAMVDVWIDLGPREYWNDSARIYSWMIGHNPHSIDLQASDGSFYSGLDGNGLISTSDLTSTLMALYSFIRAQYVSIPGTYPVPEFTGPAPLLVGLLLGGLIVRALGKRPHGGHMSKINSPI